MARDGTAALLIGAGTALVVVTAALTRYVVELAAASTRAEWSRRVNSHARNIGTRTSGATS